ncbi:hypothetical protein BC936DRAFT_137130 [Jimgerdemannia flammicorona]|uniref:Tho complex subunit 7-domain-containing protein n=1 Tax=Jimgerdemannia flammicorona TaxID=994334 RepID=A0A433DJD3_9FUNG|nr:hypothetical protein BC936DRAFT_137130 [Jimgerdemannia flammicorona]
MMRHQLIHDMNEREVKHYEEECARIDQEVAEARHDIVKLQIELEKAQQARSNKIEYDVLANDINKHQSREKSHMYMSIGWFGAGGVEGVVPITIGFEATQHLIINQLNTHIRTLEREKATYATTFELRKKQFHALIAGVHELQDSIKEEREKGDEITAIMLNMEDALDVDGGGGGGGATPLPIQAPSPALLRVGSMGVGEGAASAQEDGEDEEGMVVESDGRRGSTDEGGEFTVGRGEGGGLG